MIKYVLIFFPLLLFVLIRQFYTNLLGINRDLLTALLISGFAVFAVLAFQMRMREARSDFLVFDFINLAQFFLAASATYIYFIAGRIESGQAIYGAYYNCIAPFLIYAGFLLWRLKPEVRQAALVALGLAYAVTVLIALFEVSGIEFWLFRYDRWTLIPNYLGIPRAAGLYGTQIDYGCLSFLAFIAGLYSNARRRHPFAIFVAVAGALGTLLAMSRAWIIALVVVVLLHVSRSQTIKAKLKAAFVILVIAAALYVPAAQLGVIGMLQAVDAGTQESNQGHLWFYQNAPEWMNRFMFVGTGPGTQNGPDAHEVKIVSDFLWLATLMEFGTMLGAILVLFRATVVAIALWRSYSSQLDSPLRPLTLALCIAVLVGSFANGAFAHPVSIAAFYVIVGLFLYVSPAASAAREHSLQPEMLPV